MRIFIGLTEIAGYYSGLKLGFDLLKVECCYVSLDSHVFSYKVDKSDQPFFPRFLEKILHCSRKNNIPIVVNRILKKIFAVLLFVWALPRYDVFIFGNACRMFPCDLPILKLFGKKIIWIFHGGDSRPVYIDGGTILTSPKLPSRKYLDLAKKQKKRVNYIDKYVDFVLDNPPACHFHTRPIIATVKIGLPNNIDIPITSHKNQKTDNRLVRILHSPSNRQVKGSDIIVKAIEDLKKEYKIEFVQISGKPNHEVLEELRNCDFVVDQLYSDGYMPGFATEAAWLQKAVVIGGYAWEELNRFFAPHERPPTAYCHPDNIKDTIEKLIVDIEYRDRLGKIAYEYVSTHWGPKQVANNILKLINDDYPSDWVFDPRNVTFAHGGCMPDDMAKHMVKQLIELGGVEALCLSDKPQLEALFVKFANS